MTERKLACFASAKEYPKANREIRTRAPTSQRSRRRLCLVASTESCELFPLLSLTQRKANALRAVCPGCRLPPALCSGADVFGVYLPVQVLADKVSYDGEDHDEGRFADAHEGDQEDYKPRDKGPPLLVGPGGHLHFLSLRGGSLYRDFDVFDGDALLPEHLPDVLPGARSLLGVVTRRRHPYADRDDVSPIFGGERDGR